jgi:hypothetical protein
MIVESVKRYYQFLAKEINVTLFSRNLTSFYNHYVPVAVLLCDKNNVVCHDRVVSLGTALPWKAETRRVVWIQSGRVEY